MDAFVGTFVHTPVYGGVEVLRNVAVIVGQDGFITEILREDSPGREEFLDGFAIKGNAVHKLSEHEIFLPGFIDTHVHAPQWPQLGTRLHLPLEDWLQKTTFPLESQYHDCEFATSVYESLVPALLGLGTTTALYFSSIHVGATKVLANVCKSKGQRAFVGKVSMDNVKECPDYYVESTEEALRSLVEVVEYIRQENPVDDPRSLVHPVVTPRFLPSCTEELLEGLGKVAKEFNCHVQSHCSESKWQTEHGQKRFQKTDAEVFAQYGLLTDKTVLAHSIFLSKGDRALLRDRGAGLSHCPLSNFYFGNAAFPVAIAREEGLKVGLGTDIGGGPSASMYNAIRIAAVTSKTLQNGSPHGFRDPATPDHVVDHRHAFWLATVGGAECLGISATVGHFGVGMAFDAQLVRTGSCAGSQGPRGYATFRPDGGARPSPAACQTLPLSDEDVFAKAVYGAEASDIKGVWVQGRQVHGEAPA